MGVFKFFTNLFKSEEVEPIKKTKVKSLKTFFSKKTIKGRVRLALINSIRCRDNDEVMVSEIWKEDLEAKGYDLKTLTADEVLQLLSDGKLTKFDSVRRVRSLIQNSNPHLRGDLYHQRR